MLQNCVELVELLECVKPNETADVAMVAINLAMVFDINIPHGNSHTAVWQNFHVWLEWEFDVALSKCMAEFIHNSYKFRIQAADHDVAQVNWCVQNVELVELCRTFVQARSVREKILFAAVALKFDIHWQFGNFKSLNEIYKIYHEFNQNEMIEVIQKSITR